MRQVAVLSSISFIFLSIAAADPVGTFADPKPIRTIEGIDSRSIGRLEGPDPSVLRPVSTADGQIYILMDDQFLARLNSRLEVVEKAPVLSEYAYYDGNITIPIGDSVGVWFDDGTLDLCVVKGRFIFKANEIDPLLQFVVALDSAIIYRADAPGIRYVVFVVNPDGSVRRMEHEEALAWLPKNVPGVTVKDGELFYKGNTLKTTGRFNQVDDDGNFYSTRTVYRDDDPMYTINSTTDDYDNYLQSFIDNEGNFWAMDFTKDEKESLVLLYAGRDWGYQEPPKKAVTTDSGLRIRLRASTDAFVLGSLGKGEAVTILKTGANATIGGVTAPWYRIKKADGLIGWAFGGYIKVIE